MNSLLNDNPHFTVFGVEIYAYAVTIVLGILLGTLCSAYIMKKRNIKPELILDYFIVVVPCALVFTRVFYCITGGVPISEWISGIKEGGLSIIGGIIGGILGVGIVSAYKKINFFRVGDCIAPCLLLGQAIGRWGNFLNQEVYGFEITSQSMMWLPIVQIDGKPHLALFFIESVLNLIGFVLISAYLLKCKKKPSGLAIASYLIFYGTIRAILEPLRDSQFILGSSSLMTSQLFSIILAVAGYALLFFLLIRNKKKEGLFLGSINGDEDTTKLRIE